MSLKPFSNLASRLERLAPDRLFNLGPKPRPKCQFVARGTLAL